MWSDAHFGYRAGSARADLSFDRATMRAACPRRRGRRSLHLGRRAPAAIPWEDTIIYEAHVKGLTQLREDVPPAWRGTFRGSASRRSSIISSSSGVTTLELLPIHAFIDDRHLIERGLSNYWGYNTLGFARARYA